MKTRKLIIIFAFLMVCINLQAQDGLKARENYFSLNLSSTQIKDQANYGLVHKGMMISGEYTYIAISDKNTISYSAELGLGANGRKGLGINLDIKAVDIFYGFNIHVQNTLTLALGPYLSTYYQWYLYPELHSGHMNWMSSFEIGPRIMISIPVEDRRIDVSISNSTAGLNSRPEFQTEQYNYSLRMIDIISNPNRNMILAFQNKFNHYEMNIRLVNPTKQLSLGYELEVFEFRPEPEMKRINHSVKLVWKLGNNK